MSGLLALAALAALSSTGTPSACYQACAAVVATQQRSQVCASCVHGDPDRGGWVLRLGKLDPFPASAVDAAFGQPDWQVRWGAIRARAAEVGHEPVHELARIVAGSKGRPRHSALFVAAHLAARERVAIGALWRGARWAAAADQGLAGASRALVGQLEVELYNDDRILALEALEALAHLRRVPPARAVLDAMASRERSTDPIAAALLVAAAARGKGVGHQLLEVGRTPADQRLIDALLALYSKAIDERRARLESMGPEERQQLAESLAAYAPLAERELEVLLGDRHPLVRRAAARAIAAGSGQTLLERSRDPKLAAPVRARLVEALEGCTTDACAEFLKGCALDPSGPGEVRAAAIGALGARADRLLTLEALTRSPEPPIRAAALLALPPQLPNRRARCDLVEAALDDPEPQVLAAAVRRSVAVCGAGLLEEVAGLSQSPFEDVRAAVVTVLADSGHRAHAALLAQRLRGDESAEIRLEAVRGLTRIGGAEAASALAEAARRDASSRVRHEARQSLRTIGFAR